MACTSGQRRSYRQNSSDFTVIALDSINLSGSVCCWQERLLEAIEGNSIMGLLRIILQRKHFVCLFSLQPSKMSQGPNTALKYMYNEFSLNSNLQFSQFESSNNNI
ncbi:hypothetical protein QQ045_005749 [Rhodiola kirilowii]